MCHYWPNVAKIPPCDGFRCTIAPKTLTTLTNSIAQGYNKITMTTVNLPTRIDDPINAAILSVSEDRIQGFESDPFQAIARIAEIDCDIVLERIRAMLAAGVIRRVRQTLMATNLAQGSLIAWQVDNDRLDAAFDMMYNDDPFSGHVVIRTADPATPGATYRLWTTLKVPQGFSMTKHCDYLRERVSARAYLLMPAKALFVLGVGHVRRRGIAVGSMAEITAEPHTTEVVELSDLDWQVLTPLKREFEIDEITRDPWRKRAAEAGVDFETFCAVAQSLNDRKVIGRFSTFLEHAKPDTEGERQVTRYNGLFHWAVPAGREMEAGEQVGRFHIMTHAYWREGGPEFKNVNIMGVAHGMDKDLLLQHKAAMDRHLAAVGIPVLYTNVFWGGRSEIKPSEIAPDAYVAFCNANGLDPEAMKGPALQV